MPENQVPNQKGKRRTPPAAGGGGERSGGEIER